MNTNQHNIRGGIYSQGSYTKTGGQGAPAHLKAICIKKVQGKNGKYSLKTNFSEQMHLVAIQVMSEWFVHKTNILPRAKMV